MTSAYEAWAVVLASGPSNAYALEDDARDVLDLIRRKGGECELRHFENDEWIAVEPMGGRSPEPDTDMTSGQEADPVVAYLAGVRERWALADGLKWDDYGSALFCLAKALRSLADVPRLLAAVRAVRRLAAMMRAEAGSGDVAGWPSAKAYYADLIDKAVAKALTGSTDE